MSYNSIIIIPTPHNISSATVSFHFRLQIQREAIFSRMSTDLFEKAVSAAGTTFRATAHRRDREMANGVRRAPMVGVGALEHG